MPKASPAPNSTLSLLIPGKFSRTIFKSALTSCRGVGLSTPYKCPRVQSVTGSSLPLADTDGLNATYITNVNQGLYCDQSEYREASTLVGTAFTARDLMSIVNALGEDGMIRYWGSSYGTLLGATIGAMFPDKIDRMILDGNINPTDYYHGTNEESVDDADAAQSNFFAACASAGPENCALAYQGATGPELEQQYLNFLEGYANGSLVFVDSNQEVWGYNGIKSQLYGDLKYPSEWNSTARQIAIFMQGSVSPNVAKRAASFDPTEATTDAGSGYVTLEAITCGDWDEIPGNGTLKDFQNYLKLYTDRSPHNGDMLISILYACATWKVNAKEKYAGSFENVKTKNPVLFINGHLDPVTPLVSAQNSSHGFVGSGVLETNLAGHCSSAEPSKCVTDKITSYFSTGKLPDLTTKCNPDTPAFMPMDTPYTNTTDGGSKARYHGRRFEHDPNFEYPAALREVKRDVYEILLEKRQASSTLPNCTSLATGTGSSTSASSTGKSSGTANAAVGMNVGVSGLVLSVLAVAGAVLTTL